MTDTLSTISIKNLPESMLEISAELSWDAFSSYEDETIKTLGANLAIDGFRKGSVPQYIIRKELGDQLILTDMAERAIAVAYSDIITEKDLQVIGRPNVSITKLARGNALGFTITTAVLPSIALPDYKNLAKAIAPVEATSVNDDDVNKVVEELREMRAYGHVHTPENKEAAAHNHTETLPVVDDEFAKSFGNFNTVEELRAKVKENLIRERGRDALDKRRLGILESIAEKTEVSIPEVLIEAEAEKMLSQIEIDVARAGHTLEAYLKESGKTREELLSDYKPEAKKRAKMQLLLNAIAKDSSIKIEDEELKKETDNLMQTYPGADRPRTEAYASMILTNEKVLNLLEEMK